MKIFLFKYIEFGLDATKGIASSGYKKQLQKWQMLSTDCSEVLRSLNEKMCLMKQQSTGQ